ncbi:predicted protein [Naegleria gruberi]|uniref:Predicted protein n=1 Tax=Naegleria gruberi TaxID=5762 RepID=D2UZJ6_NAEGR|nr:uncharacterized protein NAEGRDRAFT_61962 [Naegleria gruberi]EFC49954.1 predicted protein [Naegleria gruberi]|eukprot:XP_002682698.1 predicted protein [Naegleria gruberi strain NEG-M]
MFIRNIFSSKSLSKSALSDVVDEEMSDDVQPQQIPQPVKKTKPIEDAHVTTCLYFTNQLFDSSDLIEETDSKPIAMGEVYYCTDQYPEDKLSYKELDARDIFVQKLKYLKCEKKNPRQLETIAQDCVLKERFKRRFLYRNRGLSDTQSKGDCVLSIGIGVVAVNDHFQHRVLEKYPNEENGPFFQLVPVVGNRYFAWNDSSIITVGHKVKAEVTTLVDLVKLVNQEQVEKIFNDVAEECCYWNLEKLFCFDTNNSYHFLKIFLSRILLSISQLANTNDEQRIISKKSIDEIIETKLTYSIKTYVREFVEPRGFSRAIIPLSHKVKPFAPDLLNQFGSDYKPLVQQQGANTLTLPILFTSEEQLCIYKKIVESNMSTYFMSDGIQEFRFWNCLRRKFCVDKSAPENNGVLQIILKDKAFDLYDYITPNPQR